MPRIFFISSFNVVLLRQIWATDCGEIRSKAEAVVNAGTRTWCIGNTRRKLSTGHARRGDERLRHSNVKRVRPGRDYWRKSSALRPAPSTMPFHIPIGMAMYGHDYLSTVRVTPFLVTAFLADQSKTVLT